MEVKYSSYTEAQKRATKKYRQSNKDKVNQQNKKYYTNKKDTNDNYLSTKNLKSKLAYQIKKINNLVLAEKITQAEYDEKYCILLDNYNRDLGLLNKVEQPDDPFSDSTEEPSTESSSDESKLMESLDSSSDDLTRYELSSSDESTRYESSSSDSSSSESSSYEPSSDSSSDESKTSVESDESNKSYIDEAECLETRTPLLVKKVKKPRKPRTKKDSTAPINDVETPNKKRNRNKKIKQDSTPPIIMEFEQNSIEARFAQPI